MFAGLKHWAAGLGAIGYSRDARKARAIEDRHRGRARALMADASRKAAAYERLPPLFDRYWPRLVDFHLSAFDPASARRVAEQASKRGRADASAVLADLDRVDAEIAPFAEQIEAVRLELTGQAAPPSGQAGVLVLVSSMALRRQQDTEIFSQLRHIYAAIFAGLKSQGAPFSCSFRLSGHGSPAVPEGQKYISHHTIDARGGGLHFKVTDRPGCFSFDRLGYSGWAAFADRRLNYQSISREKASAAFADDRSRIIAGNVSKYRQTADEAQPAAKGPWIFVALQTAHDAVQQLAYMPMLDMLGEVAAHAQRTGVEVVVKRHPRCRSRTVAKALAEGQARGLFTVSAASIHTLISGSLAVCTVNSSVGAEALLHLKPVYLFGRAEYQQACFRVENPGDFAKMFTPGRQAMEREQLLKFMYALRREYATDVRDAGFEERLRDILREFVGT